MQDFSSSPYIFGLDYDYALLYNIPSPLSDKPAIASSESWCSSGNIRS